MPHVMSNIFSCCHKLRSIWKGKRMSEVGSTARTPVVTIDELETFDTQEMTDGYADGLNLEMEPGANRSKAYWHGWRNGRADRTGVIDADQRLLAKRYLEHSKTKTR